MKTDHTLERSSNAVALLAWGTWFGGLVALGAISAPLVFRNVPAPYSADAMTLVFRRFDLFAMACAAIVVGRELASVLMRPRIQRIDAARMGAALIAGALAVVEGVCIAPEIAELHHAGAVRNVGELGMRLEAYHARAESVSKVELFVLVAYVVLFVFSSSPRIVRDP
ncbi:DUF4149 domain-containing protein [Pendulispora rubella]|uniref:DUF4149 domain-containing protein n=1 Tax=Pendulispora rubella TaxID=2741070 RepID=A0ABZ2LH29_9BACT